MPLTSLDLVEILVPGGTTATGITVSDQSAPKSTAVWRAISLLSGMAASLPLKAYQPIEDGRREVQIDLIDRPHPTYTRFELIELTMVHLLTNGNAYFVKQRNRLGDVVTLSPLSPNTVIVNMDDDGNKTFEVPGKDKPRIEVGSDVIMHIPGMGYDGVRGWSPISMCRQALSVGMAAEEFSARFFGNGTQLGGVLQTEMELTKEQAEAAGASFRAKVAGLGKAHEVAVLHKGLKFQPVSISPEDSQLIESRRFSIEDVGRIYGIPNHLLGDATGSTSWGSGLETQVRGLLTFTGNPWLTRIEDRWTKELMAPDVYVEFNRNASLQSDTKTKYEAYEIAVRTGWLKNDEIRRWENLPPRDDVSEGHDTQDAGLAGGQKGD